MHWSSASSAGVPLITQCYLVVMECWTRAVRCRGGDESQPRSSDGNVKPKKTSRSWINLFDRKARKEMGSSWNSTGSLRWERWKQVYLTEGKMVRHKGESCSRVTLRQPGGVWVKEIGRWGFVTRASEWVREIKGINHLKIWVRMEEERVVGRRDTMRRNTMSQTSNFANFFFIKYWSLMHEYLKGDLFVSLPFGSNISVISLISHESTKCHNKCKKVVIILYWVLKCMKSVAKVYYFFIREKKCACFMHCFSATREQWTYSS